MRKKRDAEMIRQVANLIRWQTMMILKGFSSEKIQKEDWTLYEDEKTENIKVTAEERIRHKLRTAELDRRRREKLSQ